MIIIRRLLSRIVTSGTLIRLTMYDGMPQWDQMTLFQAKTAVFSEFQY